MRPFRKHVALAIDGGGIRGIIPAMALSLLEEELGKPVYEIFELAAGTSTGSILAAGVGACMDARQMADLYRELGSTIFPRSLRSALWPLTRCRYPDEPLHNALMHCFGGQTMGSFWEREPMIDVVITTFDLLENRTRFIKSWKKETSGWPVAHAVQSSCTVPTYFPVVDGRYIDGGVGSYANPCYLAAYEALICLGWDPQETTLISLGTGREAHSFDPQQANRLWAWEWLTPILGAFMQSAGDQQVHLVENLFARLDFRRFQIELREPIGMDDPGRMDELTAYGVRMGRMILDDRLDPLQKALPQTLFRQSE